MNFNGLKYFYYVVKEGGFTRAAQALRIAQPAISKFVKDLETEIGRPLLERSGRKIRLTRDGGDVYRHCEIIFRQIEKINSYSIKPDHEDDKSVSVSSSDSIANYLLPSVITTFHHRFPKIRMTAVTGTASDLCVKIQKKIIDFGFFFHLPDLDSNLEIRDEWMVPHYLVISQKHQKSEATRSHFIGSREIEDFSTQSFPTLRKIQEMNPETSISISTNCIKIHKELVLSGLGISILPYFVINQELETKKLLKLYPQKKWAWPIKWVCRKEHRMSSAESSFIELLKRNTRILAPSRE